MKYHERCFKIGEGKRKANALREAYKSNTRKPCVGCDKMDNTVHLYAEVLPRVVWICITCQRGYEDARPHDGQ